MATKKWEACRFAHVGQALTERGLTIVVTAGPILRKPHATIYASWASMKCEESRAAGKPSSLEGWLEDLLGFIRVRARDLGLEEFDVRPR